MNKEDPIQKLLKNANASTSHSDQMTLFNISVVIYDGNKEFVIGNAQIAIEDLIDMVDTYHS
jgi:precorrin isomerase